MLTPSTNGSRPTSSTWPSASTICRLCTWRRIEPYFSQRLPAASMAIMLPMVVTLLVAGSGPNKRPELAELIVEALMHHARLHANPIFVDANDAAQMGRKIEDQARPERFAGHARSGPAGVDGQMILGRRIAGTRPRRPSIADERPPAA